MYSDQYVEHQSRGPFSGRVDPWAEAGRYFQQIHSGMIDSLLVQMKPDLNRRGYIVGKEVSLQIAEGREPDIFVQRAMDRSPTMPALDYELAAAEVLANPGVIMEADVRLEALHIKQLDHNDLVTVVEIISPSNKDRPSTLTEYRARRERLLLDHGVNVVEIDLTRSMKRLVYDLIAVQHAYHVAIYMPGVSPRFVGIDYGQALERVALPLRGEVFAVELQRAYDRAYQLGDIAAQIDKETHYLEEAIPFPSLLSDQQRAEALRTAAAWREKLDQLKPDTP